jgi:tetratricopeptide (TPR) repeat protein
VTWAERALAAADRHGWAEAHVRSLSELGQIASMRGSWDRGEQLLRESVERSRTLSDRSLYIGCIHALADALAMRGLPDADKWYRVALDEALAVGDVRRATFASLLLALTAIQAGDYQGAIARLQALQDASREVKSASANESALRGAQVTLASLGIVGRAYADLFVGRACLGLGRFVAAREALTRSVDAFDLHGRHSESAAALIGLVASDAGLARWDDFDVHLRGCGRFLRQTGVVYGEIAGGVSVARPCAAPPS